MVRNLVIVAILVLALSNKVKGACNPSACNSEQTRYLRILSDNPTLQELCQSGNAYIDCAKRILTDCGADSYVSQLERMQKLMNEKGCALSIKVEGACDPGACNSDLTRYLRIASDNPTLQELCQSGNAYLDCAKRILTDCGADSTVSELERIQKSINEQGCGSAGKLFVCSPLLILLLFLSKSVN
ncbi:uncharacterized protein LOC124253568 isoform X1 [Haliotis rubra]|uniref:uncharacterized protein LOC124253568 isoform X1 n=1 Tax=Haliotis rubra TaxID=36100 RepID=UPI001EE4EE81|nr:uncharacterized protein LOC124253568 isoform X1 [Haliotis rubra]